MEHPIRLSFFSENGEIIEVFDEDNTEFILNAKRVVDFLSGTSDTFIVHTSGSTGIPKPVTYYKPDVLAAAKISVNHFGLNANQTFFVCLPTNKTAGLMQMARAFVANAKVFVVPPTLNLVGLSKVMAQCNVFSFIPAQLQYLLSNSETKNSLSDAELILVGGAPIHYHTERLFNNSQLPIFQTFAATETLSHFAVRCLNTPKLPYKIIDPYKIRIDSDGLLSVFVPFGGGQWHSTGDIVEKISETEFRFIGRADNTINSGGLKIAPELLEAEIAQIFSNSPFQQMNFTISSVPDAVLGQKIAFVTIDNNPLALTQIHQLLKEKLKQPQYCPQAYFGVDVWAQTSTGKIDRKALAKQIATEKPLIEF